MSVLITLGHLMKNLKSTAINVGNVLSIDHDSLELEVNSILSWMQRVASQLLNTSNHILHFLDIGKE